MIVQTRALAFVSLCMYVTFGGAFGYYSTYDDNYNTLKKLDKIDDKLDVLTNEVIRISDAVSESTDNEAAALDPVVLVTVSRQIGEGGNKFTINCTKNFDEVFYEVYVQDYLTTFGTVVGERGGLSSFTFTCNGLCKNEEEFVISISNKNQSSGMELELFNNSTQTAYQSRFTVPILTYKHSGDLVFYHGRNVSITISASYGDDEGFSYVTRTLSGVREDRNTHETFEGRYWVDKSEGKRFLETKEIHLTIRTASLPICGYLDLSLRFDDSDAFLVRQIKVKRSIVVRPSILSSPFPDDFLDFKDTSRSYYQNSQEAECIIGQNCTFSCVAVGKAITSMDVKKQQGPLIRHAAHIIANYTEENEQWDDVSNTSVLEYDYSRVILWTNQFTDDDNNTQFKCIARTATQNTTQNIEVILISEEFVIDEERSGIEIDIDEENPSIRNITVHCTVVGRPLMYAHFKLYNDEDNNYYYPQYVTAEIVPLGGGEYELRTTLKYNLPYDLWHNDFTRITCNAESLQSREAHLSLTLPDTQN